MFPYKEELFCQDSTSPIESTAPVKQLRELGFEFFIILFIPRIWPHVRFFCSHA